MTGLLIAKYDFNLLKRRTKPNKATQKRRCELYICEAMLNVHDGNMMVQ